MLPSFPLRTHVPYTSSPRPGVLISGPEPFLVTPDSISSNRKGCTSLEIPGLGKTGKGKAREVFLLGLDRAMANSD